MLTEQNALPDSLEETLAGVRHLADNSSDLLINRLQSL